MSGAPAHRMCFITGDWSRDQKSSIVQRTPHTPATTAGERGGGAEDGILPERSVRSIGPGRGRGPSKAGDALPDRRPPDAASRPDLSGDEKLLLVLRGIGSVMFLTTERMIVARDGFERRPRTGIQSFALETIRHLRLELGASPSGRIAVWTTADHEVLSMFFDARAFDRAHEFIDIARPLIARARRRGPGHRPVHPPSGPAGSGFDPPA